MKASGASEENGDSKTERETSSGTGNKEGSKPEPPKDYIHVRARRGQATDSHSLAERVNALFYAFKMYIKLIVQVTLGLIRII